ncbi:hypothetical protein [Bradyrhizobium sp. 200]|uniref:hypothetical protein n=1 Tax=Bradyrhizobium sp. 200 TaxID=2782665 RepID=UPI001FFEA5F9|nr:hypothetical protein [Bradyrhizobium sp. 200]
MELFWQLPIEWVEVHTRGAYGRYPIAIDDNAFVHRRRAEELAPPGKDSKFCASIAVRRDP